MSIAVDVLSKKLESIKAFLSKLDYAYIAFSGGVDSTVLLKLANDILRDKVTAVTIDSPTLTRGELIEARQLAESICVRHLVFRTNELNNPIFVSNPPDRCYHCKKLRFSTLSDLVELERSKTRATTETKSLKKSQVRIVDGTNADDLSDWRPGLAAAKELGVCSPFAESGLTKPEVRSLACKYNLPNWNKPSMACLASRIPYGDPITEEKLQQVERAEGFLQRLGFKQVRVRHHGSVARIEVSKDKIEYAISRSDEIAAEIKALGFYYSALDMSGFKSGSMNSMLE